MSHQFGYHSILLRINLGHMTRIAVIGAGPAGFYASAALLRRFGNAHLDIIERLPVPFGLVRYGVAPDHPSTRNVISQFSGLMKDNEKRLSFFGNLQVLHHHRHSACSDNTDIPTIVYERLAALYDSVVFATGAARPRPLYAPVHGSRTVARDVYGAHDFVLWLNGHPDLHVGGERQHVGERIATTLLRAEQVSVIGAGNVAIDISRLLLRPRKHLLTLDASPTALHVLANAPAIQNVSLFARRAPPLAKWTTAALREICSKVPGVVVRTDRPALRASIDSPVFKPSRTQMRMLDVLTRHTLDLHGATRTSSSHSDSAHYLTLTFNTAVDAFSMNEGKLRLHLRDTAAAHESGVHLRAETDERRHACDAAFLSLGYESGDRPPSGIAVGWANGMARGIIGDNKWDAESVVAAMPAPPSSNVTKPGVREWLRECPRDVVSWNGWLRIEAEETRRARQSNYMSNTRRIESRKEMLHIANNH